MDFRAILTYDMGQALTAEQTAALAAGLGGAAIVTAEPGGTLTVEHTVDNKAMSGALALAIFDTGEALQRAALKTRAGKLEPVAATVAEADWHAAQTVKPGMPGVVTITEAATILGVSQQRASRLAATDPTFPDSVNPGREPRLYDEQQMRHYAATRPRRAGRPKRTAD